MMYVEMFSRHNYKLPLVQLGYLAMFARRLFSQFIFHFNILLLSSTVQFIEKLYSYQQFLTDLLLADNRELLHEDQSNIYHYTDNL